MYFFDTYLVFDVVGVGRHATADGSTMTTFNMDCAECDWRVNKVPAMDHPEGSMRPIYLLSGAYPRQVRNDRQISSFHCF